MHIVTAIEESKDLVVYSLNEQMGSVEANEKRMDRSIKKSMVQAFQMKVDISNKERSNDNAFGGRGGYRGRSRG